eukprot:jgi/Mesvir1/13001/Mv06005-RA.1
MPFPPGERLERAGDEIIVCGQLFHTNARVITWLDPGGYSGYAPAERDPLKSGHPELVMTYGSRKVKKIVDGQPAMVPVDDWDLPRLQAQVHQLVLHYDGCGTSDKCFRVIHDERGLSIHFMIDIDGTIYQTLDLKERAWHATVANDCSVGVELANIGCCPGAERSPLFDLWYGPDASISANNVPSTTPVAGSGSSNSGAAAEEAETPVDRTDNEPGGSEATSSVYLRLPPGGLDPRAAYPVGGAGQLGGFVGRPIRPYPVRGRIQGIDLQQYDFTREQYESLACLAAALSVVFPRLKPVYPTRDMEEPFVVAAASTSDAGTSTAAQEGNRVRTEEAGQGGEGDCQEAGQGAQRDQGGTGDCDDGSIGKLGVALSKLKDDVVASFEGFLGHYHIQRNKVDPGPALQWDLLKCSVERRLGAPCSNF